MMNDDASERLEQAEIYVNHHIEHHDTQDNECQVRPQDLHVAHHYLYLLQDILSAHQLRHLAN